MTNQLNAARQHLLTMTPTEIATRYFHAEYGDTVSADLVAEVVAELTVDQVAAIVASVQDQPHLIER